MIWDYSEPSDNRLWLNGSVKTKTVKGEDGKDKKKWGRRRLILGKWHEIKLEMYAHYLHHAATDEPEKAGTTHDQDLDPVPF